MNLLRHSGARTAPRGAHSNGQQSPFQLITQHQDSPVPGELPFSLSMHRSAVKLAVFWHLSNSAGSALLCIHTWITPRQTSQQTHLWPTCTTYNSLETLCTATACRLFESLPELTNINYCWCCYTQFIGQLWQHEICCKKGDCTENTVSTLKDRELWKGIKAVRSQLFTVLNTKVYCSDLREVLFCTPRNPSNICSTSWLRLSKARTLNF